MVSKRGLFHYFTHFRVPAYQYSFVGPVSISKGCDLARPQEVVRESAISELFSDTQGKDIFSSSEFSDYTYEYRGTEREFINWYTVPQMTVHSRPEPCGGDGRLVLHGVDRGAIRVGAGGELQREAEEQSQPSLYSVFRKHQWRQQGWHRLQVQSVT